MQPQVLQLRRLVIAEAGRFPELARAYHERAQERVLATLASRLQGLAERGSYGWTTRRSPPATSPS
jgi:TetR/AcrR family transcriptional regulator, mexJK operon transcriptional repressor